MRSGRWRWVPIALLGVAGTSAPTATAQSPAAVDLVRCRSGSPAICARVAGKFGVDPDRALTLQLGKAEWAGPDVVSTDLIQPPAYLLVLLDVSGSMSGFGIAHTRAPLRTFIGGLPESTVRVAVVPFGSRGVVTAIRGAQFTTPEGAVRQLDAVLPPDRAANTALYSAVRAGAEVLGTQRLEGAEVRRVLLVVTDGVNEVGPRDDPGLLANDGLPVAASEVARAGVELLALGLGPKVGTAQLDSLAAPSGRAYISPLDQLGVAEQLGHMRRHIADQQRLTFASGADPAYLARIVREGRLIRPAQAGRAPVNVSWQPPLLALPVLSGAVGDSLGSGTALVVATAVDWRLERLVYAALLTMLLVFLWMAVPRWLWPATVMEREVLHEKTERPKGGSAASAGSLRSNVKEAPPRSSTEVTGEFPALH